MTERGPHILSYPYSKGWLSDPLRPARTLPLSTINLGERSGKSCQVVAPAWPVSGWPDVRVISAVDAAIIGGYPPQLQLCNLFTAIKAEMAVRILGTELDEIGNRWTRSALQIGNKI